MLIATRLYSQSYDAPKFAWGGGGLPCGFPFIDRREQQETTGAIARSITRSVARYSPFSVVGSIRKRVGGA